MCDKFGEFDSVEEMNRAAAAQFLEGDFEAIREMGKENGLDPEDVADYIDGYFDFLATAKDAAMGKLNLEMNEKFAATNTMADWTMQLITMIGKEDEVARAVRKKGKTLKGMYVHILKWSFKHQKEIDQEILKEAGITYRVSDGNPSMAQARQLIRAYYLGEEDPA